MIPFAVLIPISILCFGLINKFVDGSTGLVLSLVFVFFTGGGVSQKQSVLHISYITEVLIYLTCFFFLLHFQGRYDLRGLRCVYGRCNPVSKFRNLGSHQVRAFSIFISLFMILKELFWIYIA